MWVCDIKIREKIGYTNTTLGHAITGMFMQLYPLIGLLLALVLLRYHCKRNWSSLCIVFFFTILAAYGYSVYLMLHAHPSLFSTRLYEYLSFVHYLLGPLLFWYVRGLVKQSVHFRWYDTLHLLPALFCLVVLWIYNFSSYHVQKDILAQIAETETLWPIYRNEMRHAPMLVLVLNPIKPVYLLVYAWFTLVWVLLQVPPSTPQNTTSPHALLWAFTLLSLTITTSFIHSCDILCSLNGLSANGLGYLSYLFFLLLVTLPFFFPRVIYHHLLKGQEPKASSRNNRRTPAFSETYYRELRQRIKTVMHQNRLYLNPRCNLSHLAEALQLPKYHLDCYFRDFKKKTFHTYCNQLRIKHVCKLLRKGHATGLTLEAIGEASGFKSRSAFFAAFKKAKGRSPFDYVKVR